MARARESEAVWRARVQRWERSGLGRVEFARLEGVRPTTLGWWRSQIARRDANRTPAVALARVTIVDADEGDAGCLLELVVDERHRVRVPVGFHAPTLRRLVEVLGRSS